MKLLTFSIPLALLLAGSSLAVPNIPKQTTTHDDIVDAQGWTPRPTEKPNFDLRYVKRGVWPRAEPTSGQILGYEAPNPTCGFISGRIGAAMTCDTGTCAAVGTAIGCCANGIGCQWQDLCYDSTDVSSKCDKACQLDTDVLKCTSSASPFCYKYVVAGFLATLYSCDSTKPATVDTLYTTASGDPAGTSWLPIYYTPSGSLSSLLGLFSTSRTVRTGTTTRTGAESSLPSSSLSTSSSKSTPVGAIVGGVIAGLVVIGAVIVGIVYLLLKKKRNAQPPAPEAYQVDPSNPQYPPQVPPADYRFSYFSAVPPSEHEPKHATEMTTTVSPNSPVPPYYAQADNQPIPVQPQFQPSASPPPQSLPQGPGGIPVQQPPPPPVIQGPGGVPIQQSPPPPVVQGPGGVPVQPPPPQMQQAYIVPTHNRDGNSPYEVQG